MVGSRQSMWTVCPSAPKSWPSCFFVCSNSLFCLHTSSVYTQIRVVVFGCDLGLRIYCFTEKNNMFLLRIPWNIIWLQSIVLNMRLKLYLNKNACLQNFLFFSLPKGSIVRLLYSKHSSLWYSIARKKQWFWKSMIIYRIIDFCLIHWCLKWWPQLLFQGLKGFMSFSVNSERMQIYLNFVNFLKWPCYWDLWLMWNIGLFESSQRTQLISYLQCIST